MNLDIEIPINHIGAYLKNHQKTGKNSFRSYSNEFVLRFLSPFLWKLDYPDESLSQIKAHGKITLSTQVTNSDKKVVISGEARLMMVSYITKLQSSPA